MLTFLRDEVNYILAVLMSQYLGVHFFEFFVCQGSGLFCLKFGM